MNPALEHDICKLMVGTELGEIDEIMRAAWDVCERGIEIVLVSMGGKGILLVGGKKTSLRKTYRKLTGQGFRIPKGCAGLTE